MAVNKPLVSIIIPVYNCEEYLQRCLDSVYTQTFTDYEIITVNDGSTDDSLSILKYNEKSRNNFTVIDQENHGQGYARNRALALAKGEYIQFVDSDDLIEPLTLELALARAKTDKSDFVHYDWKYSSLKPGETDKYLYINKSPYNHKSMLINGECDELLQMTHYFSVNNLYRKSFLDENNIRYGEGRVYEDNIFVVLTSNKAKRISLLHSPLYIIQRNMASSTRAKTKDDTHQKSYIQAIKESFDVFEPRTKYSTYYLVKYFQTKFIFYYVKRVPQKYKRSYLKQYVDAIGTKDINIPANGQPDRILRLSLKYDIFHGKKYSLFASIITLKTQVLMRRDKTINRLKKTKKLIKSKVEPSHYETQHKLPLYENTIVFLGFDFRYTGNSRYLYEELVVDKSFSSYDIKFITDDELVDSKHRVSPGSDEYYRLTARSKMIIAESWIPSIIKKRDGMIWIQLWHGTPLKKVLFDSNESDIMKIKADHKTQLYKNVLNWDYLVVDSPVAADKFASAFLYPRERMLHSGYPRVKFLIDNLDNESLKRKIKASVGLNGQLKQKKIILYAPTWRDYNYGTSSSNQDFEYAVDLSNLGDEIGRDYLLLYHDHNYLSRANTVMPDNCIDVSSHEIQELLLISDYLITDYSSVMFDAFAIRLTTIIYANDYAKYQKSRGVYRDIWDNLGSLIVADETDITSRVKQSRSSLEKHESLRRSYCYDSRAPLAKSVLDLMHTGIERNNN